MTGAPWPQYGSIMNGVYFGLQHVPFEAALAYPGVYPGLDTYIREMQKYQPKYTYDEVAIDGWIAADQFVTGLKAAGKNVTQKKLVAAINKETAYNGAGLTTPVNWKTAHTTATPPYCQAGRAGAERRLRAGLRPEQPAGVRVLRPCTAQRRCRCRAGTPGP